MRRSKQTTRKGANKDIKKDKKKTKKKTNKKMNKTVHQIFYNIGKGELHEIPAFYKCYKHNKAYCSKNNIKYKLWSEKDVVKLLNKPKNKKYKKLYYDFDQDIQRIDFARLMILWNLGGIYIDLDICIKDKKSIKHLFDLPYFFVKWHTSRLPYNALLGTHKNTQLYEDILEHCKESYYEKRKQPIYKKWKGRFVFQTTGHFMLQRVLKKNKITKFLDIMEITTKSGKVVKGKNPLFEDSNVSVWYSGK